MRTYLACHSQPSKQCIPCLRRLEHKLSECGKAVQKLMVNPLVACVLLLSSSLIVSAPLGRSYAFSLGATRLGHSCPGKIPRQLHRYTSETPCNDARTALTCRKFKKESVRTLNLMPSFTKQSTRDDRYKCCSSKLSFSTAVATVPRWWILRRNVVAVSAATFTTGPKFGFLDSVGRGLVAQHSRQWHHRSTFVR